jgi:hypothetical protein
MNPTHALAAAVLAGSMAAVPAAGIAARPPRANDFPTVDRVEFVIECMYRNEGKQEFLYKCSCVIDAIAREMKYDDYVAAAMGKRYRDMGGERMGVFRDAPNVTAEVRAFQAALQKANAQCGMPEKSG